MSNFVPTANGRWSLYSVQRELPVLDYAFWPLSASGGHSYLVLVDPYGNIVKEMHGTYSQDFKMFAGVKDGNYLRAKLYYGNHYMFSQDIDSSHLVESQDEDALSIENRQGLAIKAKFENAFTVVADALNARHYLYLGAGGMFDHAINSNSVWYTALKSMGFTDQQIAGFDGSLNAPGNSIDLRTEPTNNTKLNTPEGDPLWTSNPTAADRFYNNTLGNPNPTPNANDKRGELFDPTQGFAVTTYDHQNAYTWAEQIYWFQPATGGFSLASLSLKMDNQSVQNVTFSPNEINGIPQDSTKEDIVLFSQALQSASAYTQFKLHELQALSQLTSQQEASYQAQQVDLSHKMKALFTSYLSLDNTGASAFVDSRTFAQDVIAWTTGKLADFGTSTTELEQVDHLQQNIFSIYGDLADEMQSYVATNAGTLVYADLTAIKQRFADLVSDIAPIYAQAVTDSAPNLADLAQSYKVMLNHVSSGYAAILDSFVQAPGMTEQDKLFTTYGLYASMVGDLAFVLPDSNLGLDGSALSAQLSNGLDLTATTMAGLVGSLKESLAGYQLLVGEDIAMAALVEGSVNADSLAGTSANNLIFGYGSSDFVDGNSGADVIFGGAGNDTLLGDLGVDAVYGGAGDDEIWAGGDEVEAGEILDGGAGDNTLVVWDAKLQNATLSNLQTMWINDYATLTAAQFAQFSSVNGDATIIAASAGTYDISEKTVWYGTLNLQGSSGNDYLAGDGEGQTIEGGNGNDALQGNGGADTLLGGDGDDDFLTGFSESPTGEVMNGGAGSNRISSWNADLSAATISNIQTLGAHLDYVTLTAAQLSGFNTLIAYGGTPIALNAVGAGTYSLAGKTLSGAFNLNGTTGSDTLAGGTGAQTLSGGTGNDTYLQVRGGGADTVVENDATGGNTDVLQFASDVARDQLWFTQSGNDLMVQIIGTTDSVTVKDWYLGSANHTEQIKAAGGTNTLLDSQVQNLVNAMAGFAVPSTTTLSSAYHTALDPVIAANWT